MAAIQAARGEVARGFRKVPRAASKQPPRRHSYVGVIALRAAKSCARILDASYTIVSRRNVPGRQPCFGLDACSSACPYHHDDFTIRKSKRPLQKLSFVLSSWTLASFSATNGHVFCRYPFWGWEKEKPRGSQKSNRHPSHISRTSRPKRKAFSPQEHHLPPRARLAAVSPGNRFWKDPFWMCVPKRGFPGSRSSELRKQLQIVAGFRKKSFACV